MLLCNIQIIKRTGDIKLYQQQHLLFVVVTTQQYNRVIFTRNVHLLYTFRNFFLNNGDDAMLHKMYSTMRLCIISVCIQ